MRKLDPVALAVSAHKINKRVGKRERGQSHGTQLVGVPSHQISIFLINSKEVSVPLKGTLYVPSLEAVCSAGNSSGLIGPE